MRVVRWMVVPFFLALASCAKDSPTAPNLKPLGTANFDAGSERPDGKFFPSFSAGALGHGFALFDTVVVDSTRLGVDIAASTTNDSDFVRVANFLADGDDSTVCAGGTDGVGNVFLCGDEKSFFHLASADFAPHSVTQIDLRADSMSVGPGPLGGTLHTYHFSLTVFGSR